MGDLVVVDLATLGEVNHGHVGELFGEAKRQVLDAILSRRTRRDSKGAAAGKIIIEVTLEGVDCDHYDRVNMYVNVKTKLPQLKAASMALTNAGDEWLADIDTPDGRQQQLKVYPGEFE